MHTLDSHDMLELAIQLAPQSTVGSSQHFHLLCCSDVALQISGVAAVFDTLKTLSDPVLSEKDDADTCRQPEALLGRGYIGQRFVLREVHRGATKDAYSIENDLNTALSRPATYRIDIVDYPGRAFVMR